MSRFNSKKQKDNIFSWFFKIVFSRLTIAVLLLALQIGALVSFYKWLNEYMTYIYGVLIVITAIIVIHIINKDENPSFKLSWMIPILVLPVFGTLFYIFVECQIGTKVIGDILDRNIRKSKIYLEQDDYVTEQLKKDNIETLHLAYYMEKSGGYPIYKNTEAEYFRVGEEKFEALKEELKKAEKFIFMEYFIIEKSYMWDSVLEILKQKVKEGVEVRVMYDGMCSLMLLPYSYPETLKEFGIQCKMFSPIKPALSTHQNNRDHRKIVVIDGLVAFNGGINLGDEYINKKVRFGHWKDTAVMIKGEAVNSFTIMFLQMWNVTKTPVDEYEKYIVQSIRVPRIDDGYVMPYGDSPMDKESVGENVYLHIIHNAKKYVHIMTPYLILDNEMLTALKYTVKSGVEIKLIMPHIPDKWYAFWLAKTYYEELIRAGVKIYEYTPGFVHAKVFTADDDTGVVGTINLDYRSLYLHFECATYFYKNKVVHDIEKDFQDTLDKCQLVTLEDCKKLVFYKRWIGRILRLVAPLM